MYLLSKTVYLGHQPVMQSLVVHPPKKNPGSAPALHVLAQKHLTRQLHVFLCLALVTCFLTRLSAYMFPYAWHWLHVSLQTICPTPKKGRPQIQRQTFCLISVPDVNDFGHLALFVKPKKVTTEKNKKRTVIRRKSIDGSFRGSILDSIITEGRDSVSVVHVALWTPWGLGGGVLTKF